MKKVGNYLLLKVLGEGQFGTVYKASHTENPDDYYAIKTIAKKKIQGNAKLMKLFDTEMAVMSKIKHPNIMHLFEYMETGNNYYLVIQYCNNGDLEEHIKKAKQLSEDEAVYFLMQIMNGFRELHKYKIMHRDFKLANIFLNDDSVVIGDFGFAKSGADMATTKLGTPLTMAPELLNAGSNLNYTNKADLWSIGVCFYQMLYGAPPFKVSSMNELQQKVKTESGDNLKFPGNIQTSDECKSLLKGLMQCEPKKRIEWNEFFKHPLFDLHSKKSNKGGDMESFGMHQSVMFHGNKDKVNDAFEANKKQNVAEVELKDPLEIEIDANSNQTDKTDQEKKKKELALKKIKLRLTHEKKTIVFMMHTCRKVRNLAKYRKDLGAQASDNLMYAGICLLRKGQRLNEVAISSIKDNKNQYDLPNFGEFVNSPDCKQILSTLEDDQKLYDTLLSHLQKKLNEEVENKNMTAEVISLIQGKNVNIRNLDDKISQEFKDLFHNYNTKQSNYESGLREDFVIALCHMYLSLKNENELPFQKDGHVFDWKEFESNLNLNFVNEI